MFSKITMACEVIFVTFLQGDYRNLEIFDDKCNLSVKND
jgi:hypothetical protein